MVYLKITWLSLNAYKSDERVMLLMNLLGHETVIKLQERICNSSIMTLAKKFL